MPLVEKLSPYSWEVRTRVSDGIVRVMFTVDGNLMVLLHGFIKKTQKIPQQEIATTNKHVGSAVDESLEAEGLLAEAEATAAKRIIAHQIRQEMEACHISKSELAR